MWWSWIVKNKSRKVQIPQNCIEWSMWVNVLTYHQYTGTGSAKTAWVRFYRNITKFGPNHIWNDLYVKYVYFPYENGKKLTSNPWGSGRGLNLMYSFTTMGIHPLFLIKLSRCLCFSKLAISSTWMLSPLRCWRALVQCRRRCPPPLRRPRVPSHQP